MNFLIKTVTHQDLKDRDCRLIPTVIAEHISEQAKEEITAAARENETRVLKLISQNRILHPVHSGGHNGMEAAQRRTKQDACEAHGR